MICFKRQNVSNNRKIVNNIADTIGLLKNNKSSVKEEIIDAAISVNRHGKYTHTLASVITKEVQREPEALAFYDNFVLANYNGERHLYAIFNTLSVGIEECPYASICNGCSFLSVNTEEFIVVDKVKYFIKEDRRGRKYLKKE